jgi:hypothetical protein
MAKIALAAAGAGLGFFLGGPAGMMAGMSVGLAVGGELFRPKLPGIMPLQDRQVSSSADGAAIPFGYGTGRFGGQLIWCPGIQYFTVGSNSSKGAGAAAGQQYAYRASFAMAFGEGPAIIEQIWADSKLIWQNGQSFGSFAPWNADTSYLPEQLVSYQFQPVPNADYITAIFQCVIANQGIEPAGNNLYWQLTSYAYYNPDTQYSPGNQVAYPPANGQLYAPTSGQIYTCVNICQGVTPAPAGDWNTMAEYFGAPTVYPGDEAQMPDPTIQGVNGTDATPAFRGICYAVWDNFPLAIFGNRIPNMRAQVNFSAFESSPTADPTIDAVVLDLCERAGLEPTDVDVSKLSAENVFPNNTVSGYVVDHIGTAADALKELMLPYFFGACESDGLIKFVPKTVYADWGSPAEPFVIAEDDLGLVEDKAKIEEEQKQEQDLPLITTVLYNDVALNWQQGKQAKQRNARTVVGTRQQQILSLPLSLDDTIARQIAEASLYSAWTGRESFKTNLWRALYILLDATDVVYMMYEGQAIEVRIVKMSLGQGFTFNVQAMAHDVRDYGSAVQGVPSSGFTPPTIVSAVPTIMWILDLPLLRDSDSNPTGSGFYLIISAHGPQWPGAEIYQSSDNSDFTELDTDHTEASYGYAINALPAPVSPWTWDTVNTLNLSLAEGTLASESDLNVLNGANALIVGSEVIQFANAIQNSDGSWTISRLLRGRRGTEYACGTHAAGEPVFQPLAGGVLRESALLSQIGAARYYEAVTDGQALGSASSTEFTLQGNDLKPYAPVQLAGNAESATETMTGIVGLWNLDEGTGSVADDSSGLGNNGTWYGSAIGTSGYYASGYKQIWSGDFDGSTDYIDCGDAADLQLSEGTVSAWIKTSNAGSGYAGVVVKAYTYSIFLKNNEFGWYDWSIGWNGSGKFPNDGNWHLLTVTFQSAVPNGTIAYLDGVPVLTSQVTCTLQIVDLLIGAGLPGFGQFFNGCIEDVRLYDRILSPAEIQLLFQAKAGTDINLTWVRRTRIGGAWLDGIGTVPLAEENESYDVEILKSGSVVRTLAGLSSPSAVYALADQIADFGEWQSSVTLNVYQNSAAVGRGFKATATVAV